jgi:tetratricopeptide (TPR) repeat protein
MKTSFNSFAKETQTFRCTPASSLFFVLFSLFFCLPVHADQLDILDENIESWHFANADKILADLDENKKTTPRARYLAGKLLFFKGKYADALPEFRQAIEGARAEIAWKILRDRAQETARVFSKLEKKIGPNGQFVFRYQQGPDAILIPYAENTLRRQLSELTKLLGHSPDFPIEIAILPDVETMASVTGLLVEQIERTGTVGVTKYGRVMILSPRKLATGYPWLDTLAHEFTHLVITRISNNHAPIWLHEGIAKFLETRWRDQTFGALTPEEAYLLDRASREGRLIPLRRFHPSIAALPNQEDAALAYAQVFSFMHYLNGKLEQDWIRQFLEHLGSGMKIDDTVWKLSKFSLHRLYAWWKQSVSGKRQTPVPAVELMKRRFKHGKATGEGGLESLLSADVRKHLRVGDLLRLRGHIKAAEKEYKRAHKLAQSPSPKITDRLAACYLELGNQKAVISMLPKMAELYPAHATTFIQLGTALAIVNRHEEAAKTLEKANAINPFHPEIHCKLRELYTKAGRTSAANREAEHCRILAAHSDKQAEEKR